MSSVHAYLEHDEQHAQHISCFHDSPDTCHFRTPCSKDIFARHVTVAILAILEFWRYGYTAIYEHLICVFSLRRRVSICTYFTLNGINFLHTQQITFVNLATLTCKVHGNFSFDSTNVCLTNSFHGYVFFKRGGADQMVKKRLSCPVLNQLSTIPWRPSMAQSMKMMTMVMMNSLHETGYFLKSRDTFTVPSGT
jgi:hypothetical protein